MSKNKTSIVVGLFPDKYEISDFRLNKPVCHQKYEKSELVGSMLAQEIDSVNIFGKDLTYFTPNNIGILLSISNQYLKSARIIYDKSFSRGSEVHELEESIESKNQYLCNTSKKVCDYIELIQISIVFGYTAIETFANMSIPDNYEYKKENKSKGIHELYEKESIERWISLKEKIQSILTIVYKSERTDVQKWWGRFSNLEQYRNDIIHQKSIKSTEYYKNYFKPKIFDICSCPKDVIRFFYIAHEKNNQTNPIWPWLENEKNVFPINTEYDSRNIEVIGNVHEGIKRRK